MYTAVITKVSELSTGGMYEVDFTIYNDAKTSQWQETASFNQAEYPDIASVQAYIKKRITFYLDSNSLVANLKKEIGKVITTGVTP